GTLLKILVDPGKTVGLRKPIAVLGEKGEAFDPQMLSPQPNAKPQEASPRPGPQAQPEQAAHPASPPPPGRPAGQSAPRPTPAAPQAPQEPGQGGAPASGARVKASPLAKKMA